MRIQDVMVHLLLKQPFYGYIAASVTPLESSETPTMNMLTAPSLKLLYNKAWFEELTVEQAIGAVIHELLHLILMHPYRKGSRERHLWTVACDMAVNEHIELTLLPPDAVTVETIAKEIKEKLPPLKSAEFYYDIISKSEETLSLLERNNDIKVVLRSGAVLSANKSVEADSSEVNKNAFKSTMTELIEQAKSEGEIPNGVYGFVEELYRTGEVNWRNVLKRFLSGKGKVLKRKTCKKESKRFENLPGVKRTVGTNALLALDESGSINEKQLVKFYNELLAIKKITGADISVTRFDTQCTPPIPIEKYVRTRERLHNGGTDFRPVFRLADKIHIPLLVIFTDGDGIVPESCNQKVLWVLTKGGRKPAEFGYSVSFEE